jgi:hypothetical protein
VAAETPSRCAATAEATKPSPRGAVDCGSTGQAVAIAWLRRTDLPVVCWLGLGRGVQVEAVPVPEMLKQAPQRRRRGQR